MNQSNPVAVVTGVGPGTGAAIVRRFAEGGYSVAMIARDHDRLDALARDIPGARPYPCDVTDQTRLNSTLDAVRSDLGEAPSVISWKSIPRFSTAISRSTRWPCSISLASWHPRW